MGDHHQTGSLQNCTLLLLAVADDDAAQCANMGTLNVKPINLVNPISNVEYVCTLSLLIKVSQVLKDHYVSLSCIN